MAKSIKHLSTLTALTFAVGPAYGEETQNLRPNPDVSHSVSQSVQALESAVSSGPVRVQGNDIEVVGPDLVAIRSPRLAYEVTFHPQEARRLLGEVSPINLADFSLDETGRVVVRDAEFASKFQQENNLCGHNCICGYHC